MTILERSSHSLSGRGAGIVLPESLIQQCIHLELLDQNIPRLSIKERSFYVKDENNSKKIWKQPMEVVALNWGDIYSNLRKRIPDDIYHSGEEVCDIYKIDDIYQIKTVKNNEYKFDFIIAADGIESTIRKKILPEITPQYAGYVAWRGTTKISNISDQKFFDEQISYFVFPGGHLLLYSIPSSNREYGDKVLNWLIYENCDKLPLSELLIDKNGMRHTISLPMGLLSKAHIQHVLELAKKKLPPNISDIICKTDAPFLQAIFDLETPQYTYDKICFIGDAATVLRPHSGSGVVKALSDSISLTKILSENNSSNTLIPLSIWNEAQIKIARQQAFLAKTMGRALVTNSPSWEKMDSESMEKWWQTVMSGKSWYATSTNKMWKRPQIEEGKVLAKELYSLRSKL